MNDFSLAMLWWIAAAVLLAWRLPRRFQPVGMVAATVAFLLWHEPVAMGWLLLAAGIGYLPASGRGGRPALAAAIAMAVVLIGLKLGHRASGDGVWGAIIPLGMSFYALRVIHLALDAWKGTLPTATRAEYFSYLFFLPTLVAGPINRFAEFQRAYRRRRWEPACFSRGCERILYGYAMMIVLGNYLVSSKMADAVAVLSRTRPGPAEYLDCCRYGLNLYCQFAGYSHVAIGFALVLGFPIVENFRYPFLATHPADFWRRWHISLSDWCRDYIYLPALALSRRPVVAVLAAMLALGLWHEISWRYCLWGLYHGIGIAVGQAIRHRLPAVGGWPGRVLAVCGWLLTMNFVILSFLLTKEPNLSAAYAALCNLGRW